MKTKLTLGFSPCPNDTFIFDALVNNKIPNPYFDIEYQLADVEQLNKQSQQGQLDITKLSFSAYAHVQHQYTHLSVGSALGNNCGPLIIAKKPYTKNQIPQLQIAIPGKLTTANLLLKLRYPNLTNTTEYLFSDIENAVLSNQVQAGLIIHENRFTYQQKGLIQLCDLGQWWQTTTHSPIPLGCIAIKNSQLHHKQNFQKLLTQSIQYAWQHYPHLSPFVTQNAQNLNPHIMRQHIKLYVNPYTLNLGPTGSKSIQTLLSKTKK